MKKEVLAGLTTFSTMAYILIVNPLILSEAGVDFSSAMLATILLTFLGCMMMGALARYPLAIAPGVGLSAYFTYSVVIGGGVPWQTALGIVFWTGILLLILWVTGLRELIIHAIPKGLKIGTTAGVGLFLVVIGLKNAGVIVSHPQTLLMLGNLARPEILIVALALALSAALMRFAIAGALLIGLLFCWTFALALGIIEWKGIFALPAFSTSAFFQLDIHSALSSNYWMILFSFLFICLFDVSGALMGLAHQGHFLDKEGRLPRLKRALLPDAVCTTVAGLFGNSACTVYIESAAGIGAGGRRGWTAITVGFLFLLTLFFEPLAASIPLFAVTPVLVVIGALMLQSVIDLDWKDPTEFIPAFVTIVGIPLTYSVGAGIGLGILLYPVCKLFAGRWRDVHWLCWILAALFAIQFCR